MFVSDRSGSKWRLSPQFCHFSLKREKKQITKGMRSPRHLLFIFVLLFLSLQPAAPKSWVLLELDSSLHQVTQHPTSLQPSILTRPTQPLLPISSPGAGFISARARCLSLSPSIQHVLSLKHKHTHTHTHTTNLFTLPFPFHNCVFLPSSVLAVSLLFSIPISPQSTERCRHICVDFVAWLTAIQKPLLACHRRDVVRR